MRYVQQATTRVPKKKEKEVTVKPKPGKYTSEYLSSVKKKGVWEKHDDK